MTYAVARNLVITGRNCFYLDCVICSFPSRPFPSVLVLWMGVLGIRIDVLLSAWGELTALAPGMGLFVSVMTGAEVVPPSVPVGLLAAPSVHLG